MNKLMIGALVSGLIAGASVLAQDTPAPAAPGDKTTTTKKVTTEDKTTMKKGDKASCKGHCKGKSKDKAPKAKPADAAPAAGESHE
jgi:hypothetical protein